ncbi:MAG: hypothetical protein AAGF11_16285 [Myxococcota bacterium]
MVLLWVVKQDNNTLHVFCPAYHTDEFLIYNWEETDWADGLMELAPVEVVFQTKHVGDEPGTTER